MSLCRFEQQRCINCNPFRPGFKLCTFLLVGAPRSCTRDEGRSLGAGLQELASNHLNLLWSRARVVSVNCATKLRRRWRGSFEAALQGEASNRLKLLWAKAMVVSVAEKAHKCVRYESRR